MEKFNKNLWLFSQELSTVGGTSKVVKIAKEIILQASIKYNHVWLTDFSSRNKVSNGLFFRALPLPMYLNNFLAGVTWKKDLRRLRAGLVLGGGPAAGAIPYAAGISYGMWIGTSARDEFRSYRLKEAINNKDYSRILNKTLIGINNLIEKVVLKKANFIITQSIFMLNCIKNDYDIDNNKLSYLPFPISIKSKRSKMINSMEPVLLAVGRVDDDRKNYSFLLKAFKVLAGLYPRSRLRIAGPIRADSRIVQQSIDSGIASQVDFLGEIVPIDLKREYENADIFVLTPKQEGLGIVFLEAMSYGLPVVTTKCGGPEGIIEDGINGYLIEQRDLISFVGAVTKIMSTKQEYERMSEGAYQYILEKHNATNFAKQFIGLIMKKLYKDDN